MVEDFNITASRDLIPAASRVSGLQNICLVYNFEPKKPSSIKSK